MTAFPRTRTAYRCLRRSLGYRCKIQRIRSGRVRLGYSIYLGLWEAFVEFWVSGFHTYFLLCSRSLGTLLWGVDYGGIECFGLTGSAELHSGDGVRGAAVLNM